jgi:hypothetical protein
LGSGVIRRRFEYCDTNNDNCDENVLSNCEEKDGELAEGEIRPELKNDNFKSSREGYLYNGLKLSD